MNLQKRFGLGVRWQMAIMLCLVTTINYVDRQAIAVTGPVIIDEFALSNTEFGFILSGFFFAYALGQVLVGPLIDRLGSKRAFSIAVVAWSLAGMLCALGRGFWSFLTLRALLGVTEAANFPAALKSISEWFPRSERSLAVGIVTAGTGFGAIMAPPLLGLLIVTWGWQWAFIIPGAAGLIWVWVWQTWYHTPDRHPKLGDAERRLIFADRRPAEPLSKAPRPWSYFRYREVWGLMLSRFLHDGAFYFFVSWLPLYLSQARDFNIKQIAIFAWIPFVAADLGSIAGGWAGKRLIDRGMSLDRSRRLMIWSGTWLTILMLPAVAVDSAYLAIAMIGIAMFAIQTKAASLFAVPADLFPSREVATIWGVFGAAGSFGGMAFNAWAGWVTDQSGYAPVFVALGVTQVMSVLVIRWLVPRIATLKPVAA